MTEDEKPVDEKPVDTKPKGKRKISRIDMEVRNAFVPITKIYK